MARRQINFVSVVMINIGELFKDPSVSGAMQRRSLQELFPFRKVSVASLHHKTFQRTGKLTLNGADNFSFPCWRDVKWGEVGGGQTKDSIAVNH